METSGPTAFEVIPAIDVLGRMVVRLARGEYTQATEYAQDPAEVARRWADEGARRLHVVDLEGARSGQVDLDLWTAVAITGVSVQAGGGIRTAAVARAVLAAGAERVVMGTAAVWDPQALAGLGDRVVAAVDVRAGRATGAGWLDGGRDLGEVLDGLAAAGVARLLVTGISRDGMLAGPDFALTERVVGDPRFRVIASGGVSNLADLERLAALGCEGAVVGRALYEGRFTMGAALSLFR
jgi:phosphoribosylformimino-5-aminoimidazole carboxamide ribotide isomerase